PQFGGFRRRKKADNCLGGGTASGHVFPPLVVYDGVTFLSEWFDGIDDEVMIARNETGNMDALIFRNYISDVVIPYIQKLDPPVYKICIQFCFLRTGKFS